MRDWPWHDTPPGSVKACAHSQQRTKGRRRQRVEQEPWRGEVVATSIRKAVLLQQIPLSLFGIRKRAGDVPRLTAPSHYGASTLNTSENSRSDSHHQLRMGAPGRYGPHLRSIDGARFFTPSAFGVAVRVSFFRSGLNGGLAWRISSSAGGQ